MTSPSAALVTGSSRGIGRAIALELARQGYRVVVNYARNGKAAAETVAEIERSGGQAVACRADVASAADRQQLLDVTLQSYGQIDLLVNNAGIPPEKRQDLLEATEASWDRVVATNLKGPYFLTQLVAREMIRLAESGRGTPGRIVNISSLSAYTASPERGEYCVAKAGMSMMTALFAARLARHGIGVFEVRPGIIATDMTGPVAEKYDRLIAEGLTPIARWGQPEDVALAVAAIASGSLPFSTGEVINVDGGFHLRRL